MTTTILRPCWRHKGCSSLPMYRGRSITKNNNNRLWLTRKLSRSMSALSNSIKSILRIWRRTCVRVLGSYPNRLKSPNNWLIKTKNPNNMKSPNNQIKKMTCLLNNKHQNICYNSLQRRSSMLFWVMYYRVSNKRCNFNTR